MTPQELHTFLVQAQLWVGVFILGMFAQFARLLTGKYDKLTTVNIIFGGIGAGIASVSVVSILLATHLVPASFAIGISGIVGWMGGNVMTAVGVAAEHWFNKKFGTDIKVDDDKEDKK